MTNQNTAPPTSLPEWLERIEQYRMIAKTKTIMGCFSTAEKSTQYHKGWAEGVEETIPAFDALLSHIRQQDEKIKTLEMQGKWLDIKDAPRDGTRVLAWMEDRASIRQGFPPVELHGVDEIYWTRAGEGGWVSRRHGIPTHFQYINSPPDAQPEGSEGL